MITAKKNSIRKIKAKNIAQGINITFAIKQKREANVQKIIYLGIWLHELLAGKPEWMDVYVVEE